MKTQQAIDFLRPAATSERRPCLNMTSPTSSPQGRRKDHRLIEVIKKDHGAHAGSPATQGHTCRPGSTYAIGHSDATSIPIVAHCFIHKEVYFRGLTDNGRKGEHADCLGRKKNATKQEHFSFRVESTSSITLCRHRFVGIHPSPSMQTSFLGCISATQTRISSQEWETCDICRVRPCLKDFGRSRPEWKTQLQADSSGPMMSS